MRMFWGKGRLKTGHNAKGRRKSRLIKLIEPAIQLTYLSSRAEFATLSILRRPRATNFRVTREEAKALEGIVDSMAVAAAPHDSMKGEKRIVFAQAQGLAPLTW